ncbi:MAG: methyltransferase domain-containing protein [Flavobacteriales bacterium]|nr:methyltransferase domain-containing protein [Flavobacteriales bacterium]
MSWFYRLYYPLRLRAIYSYHLRHKNKKNGLGELLRSQGKTRWLDMGASGSFSDGFFFADLYPPEEANDKLRDHYFQFNATLDHPTEKFESMGKFDLIRMQHVLEHLPIETLPKAFENFHRLMNDEGWILITVPDLRLMAKMYLRSALDTPSAFSEWAETRIEKGSPQSYYFSIFTHSVPYQAHHWCFDEEGMRYAMEKSGLFKNIKALTPFSRLADVPFTHNRPGEDLCIVAQKA